jgi:nucleotide-binding universal stress UspA family protein
MPRQHLFGGTGGNAMTVRYERILVPVDGSARAEAVLPHALALAHGFGATIELVRSYAVPPALVAASAATALPGTGPALNAEPYLAAGRNEAEIYLEELEERLRPEGVRIEHRQLVGSAGESIVAESQRSGSDMIAMATHARAGIGRLVLGSVADYVVHHATCPVLLVRNEPSH